MFFIDHLHCECQRTEDLGSGKWIKNPTGTFLQGGQGREGSRRFRIEQTWHQSAGQTGGPTWFCAGTGDPSAKGFAPNTQFPSSSPLSAHPGHSSSQQGYRSSAEHRRAHSHKQILPSKPGQQEPNQTIAAQEEYHPVAVQPSSIGKKPLSTHPFSPCTLCILSLIPSLANQHQLPYTVLGRRSPAPLTLQITCLVWLVLMEKSQQNTGTNSLCIIPLCIIPVHICSFKGWKPSCQGFLWLWYLSLLPWLLGWEEKAPNWCKVTFSSSLYLLIFLQKLYLCSKESTKLSDSASPLVSTGAASLFALDRNSHARGWMLQLSVQEAKHARWPHAAQPRDYSHALVLDT